MSSELRYDTLAGEWVGIAGERQSRPNRPPDDCPFCVGGIEAPVPYEVRAFPNRWPMFAPGDPVVLEPATGQVPARGASEVVLYSPEHDSSLGSLGTAGVRRVIDLWAERTADLLARPEINYVLIFENRGADVGATIPHPHGQIYAFPFVPPVPAREAAVAEHGCALCAEEPGERLVYESEEWRAYVPYASAYPYGLLIAPRTHISGLPELGDDARNGLATLLSDVLPRYDRLFGRPFPYMLWVHPGSHLHVHIAPPGRSADALRYVAAGEVGSGTLMNPVVPERAADELRNA
ncbi:MAG TPA: galactose-1-phosphate uridylyltransferase [Gaiellaceae bacterium]|jgi:UDPglucose--hexose-1-phosphate uridylyltransferase|nr:galactose-1-phosphate uridylyltransferase [Gaiellaceae bacterium]